MAKKVNFYVAEASKLTSRTKEYCFYVLNKSALTKEFKANIKRLEDNKTEAQKDIDLLQDNKATKSGDSKDVLLEKVAFYEKEIEKYTAVYESAKEKMARVTLGGTPEESTLVETLKNMNYDDMRGIKAAMVAFFKAYGVEVAGTTFEEKYMRAFNIRSNERKTVESLGKKRMVIDTRAALRNLYDITFEYLASVNLIKEKDIPEYLRGYYFVKTEEKRKKEAEKKRKEEARAQKEEIKGEQKRDMEMAKEYDKKKAENNKITPIEQRPASELQEDATDGVTFEKKADTTTTPVAEAVAPTTTPEVNENNATTTPVSSTENTEKKDEVA